METAFIMAALAVLAAVLSTASAGAGRLSRDRVRELAELVVARDFPDVDPLMLRAMAEIESSRNRLAIRVEPHLGDASIGLMQTLVGTAQWLARDMGARRFGDPSMEDLLRPEVSMYFGAAYVNWLSTWRGRARDEDWIVMSYNGGPGADNSQTRRHLARYKAAKIELGG